LSLTTKAHKQHKADGLVPFLVDSKSSMDGWVARDRARDVELGANVRCQVER